jgi:hypothetical protein
LAGIRRRGVAAGDGSHDRRKQCFAGGCDRRCCSLTGEEEVCAPREPEALRLWLSVLSRWPMADG